jgi:NitT/TauT family transport system permease protein
MSQTAKNHSTASAAAVWSDRYSSVLPLLGIVAFVLLWALLAALPKITAGLLPSPWASLKAIINAVQNGKLLVDLGSTLYRTLTAFAFAVVLGVPFGVLLGSMPRVYRACEVLIDFSRSTPATAMFPLFLVIFGLGDFASIAVAAFAAWLVMLLNSAYGVMQSREVRRNAAKVMGASGWRLLRDVLFFDAMAQIFIGLRVAISLSLVVIVVAEMFIGARDGIGKQIIDAQVIYDLPLMYGSIVVSGLLGYALNALIIFIERRFIHWSGK